MEPLTVFADPKLLASLAHLEVELWWVAFWLFVMAVVWIFRGGR